MKIVRISNGIVQEIIPVAAAPVERWYGAAFAALCVEAPDEVEQNWIYDRETGSFFPPAAEPKPPRPSEEEILAPQMRTAVRALLAPCAVLTDDQALAMPDLVRTWEEALEAGAALDTATVLRHDGVTYRVVQPVTPQAHQPPGSEGMLAVYRPIETAHAGTEEDPIPFVYGMDALAGLYYSYAGGLYQVAEGGDMKPCVWLPDSGIWQWIRIEKVQKTSHNGGETE